MNQGSRTRRVLLVSAIATSALAADGCATSMTGDGARASAGGGSYAARCTTGAWAPDNVELTAATYVAAGEAPPAAAPGPGPGAGRPPILDTGYCRLEGVINKRVGYEGVDYGIGFSLALPDAWTERLLLQGGGGLNGSVPSPFATVASGETPALARGFAVIGHDSGHKSGGGGFDAGFSADQRAALDFSEASVRVVTETAKAMTDRFYGEPIAYSYMAGCSTGGRESMLAVERYPELFDGVVVGAPAMRTGFSNLALAWAAVQFNQAAPRDGDGLPIVEDAFSQSDRALYASGLLEQCDALDGLADGVIDDVLGCHFDPGRLQCSGAKRDDCLSATQVTALRRGFSEPLDASGHPLYSRYPNDTGNTYDGPGLPGILPTGRPGVFGPPNRDLTIDLDARAATIRADGMQRQTDTNVWTNLDTFTGHGGKVLFFHGVSDPWFSAFDTLDYWLRAQDANADAWADTSRLYFVPGMGHCGGGANTFDSFDLLSPVMAWVEQGQAPEAVVAKRTNPTPAERPLCPYPSFPYYLGGDEDDAASFECRAHGD